MKHTLKYVQVKSPLFIYIYGILEMESTNITLSEQDPGESRSVSCVSRNCFGIVLAQVPLE